MSTESPDLPPSHGDRQIDNGASVSVSVDQLRALGLSEPDAVGLSRQLAELSTIADPMDRWAAVSRKVLRPSHPFGVHEAIFRSIYGDRPPEQGPPPAWIPPEDIRTRCNLGRLMDRLGFETEAEFRSWACRDRAGFWDAMVQALGISFTRPPSAPADLSDGPERPRWFPGASLNITESCFREAPEAIAIRQFSEDGERREVTSGELRALSDRVAAGLVSAGLKPGDAVGLLLPMTVEAVAVLLGIIRAGCVAIGIPESFAPPEIALRLRLGKARLVITQDRVRRRGASLPLAEKLEGINEIPAVVIPIDRDETPTPCRPGDRSWADFLGPAGEFAAVSRDPHDPTMILFSSGTTGEPKAIPWTQMTPIKAAADGWLYHDIQPGDVIAWPTSPGWMMGPWLVFASLINRGTIALYDGHPGTEGFCRFVEEAGVTMLGVVPSLVSAWRANAWPEACDWTKIKAFSSTGECSNSSDMHYLMSRAGYKPVIEYCGGTEIGGGYITSSPMLPNAPACFNTIAYGVELSIRDEQGHPSDLGEAYLIGPSVGFSNELINRDHHEIYFEGTPQDEAGNPLRRHGDRVERLGGGYYRVHGRVDDTMNLGGIKVSAVEIERVINRHPAVRESVAVADRQGENGPDRLIVYVVPDQPDLLPETLRRELQTMIGQQLNPLFRLGEVRIIEALPRTASNKVMRRLLRDRSQEPDHASS